MRRNPTMLGLVVALAIGLVALPALAATAAVDIRDGSYLPASLTVEGNTTVTWTNHDAVSHSVTSAGGLFDSGPIEQNETFNYTFTDAGTYPYGCAINASTQRTPMQGVVIVVPEGMMVEPGGNATGEEPAEMTLADLIAGDESLTVFAETIGKAGIAQTVFSTGGPYTVFAPDDAAFEALGNETLAGLSNDTEMLDLLLMHHVVRGNYTAEDLLAEANVTENETILETLSGDNLTVGAVDGNLTVGNGTIVVANMTADNGIVHVIDTVLLPPGLVPPENATPVENVTPVENTTPVENVTVVENVTAVGNATTEPPPGERVIP